ncbi:sulfotransferase domain-containing protein [Hyphomonas sp.]|uniref:sulfotransferase domain-containing protein n=1 Tax=Hyphomonas sp. TaxID=87 RepID=UPI003242ECF5
MTATTLPSAYRTKVLNETWTNFSVLRHGAFDGVLVTSKNSGTHWLKYMLAVALADTHGIERPRYFSENSVRPYIGWPKDAPVFPELPRLAFSHTIPHRLADWGWARGLAKLPPYVLAVRHPMSILASHHAKWEYDIKVDWLTYLEGDPGGTKYRCDLYWLARFWNRWGEVLARHGESILVVHYEDTLKDPRKVLEAVDRHWGLNLTAASIEAALAAGTKDAMAEKVDPEAEPNVLQNRKTSLSDLFSGDALEIYQRKIGELFRHDLGYDLLSLPS